MKMGCGLSRGDAFEYPTSPLQVLMCDLWGVFYMHGIACGHLSNVF